MSLSGRVSLLAVLPLFAFAAKIGVSQNRADALYRMGEETGFDYETWLRTSNKASVKDE